MRFSVTVLAFMLSVSIATEAKTSQKETQWLNGWQQESGKDGISAQCRQHKNKINQCKFTTVVDESFTALSAVVLDVDNFRSWAESVLISKRMSPPEALDNSYVYTTYHFTGAYNRDAVTRYVTTQDPETKAVKIKFKTVNKKAPITDLRLVRFPLMAGYWQFKPLANGKTEIEHLSFTPPGGVVQKTLYFVFNIAYLSASFDTIKGLIKEAKKTKYQTAKFDFIRE